MRHLAVCLVFALLFSTIETQADDWPQWLGPDGASVWREKGIVDRFPDDGLEVRWRAKIADGYSGPAVAGGRVFVTDFVIGKGRVSNNPGGRDKLEGNERVLCFDTKSGDLLWKRENNRAYNISYPRGPRCTPTVDGDRVYTLGAEGHLMCLSVKNGSVIWSKDFGEDYKAKTPVWGHSAHPLVHGDLLVCIVGGPGSVAVAFNKMTGKEVWRALSAGDQGYCPPTMIEHAGRKQLLIWHPESLNSLEPLTGKVLWSQPLRPAYGMSITAPRLLGDMLYVSSIGSQGVLLKLKAQAPGAEVVWKGEPKMAVYSGNSTPFLEGEMIYGNDCQIGNLIGVKLKDGERVWQTFEPTTGGKRRASHGTVFIVKHEDRFFLFNEKGDLILANLTPEGYEEISRFHVLDATNNTFGRSVVWSHPAFAERCVFARNDKELVCVSLAKE